ncbi:MAG TPA: phage portal protein, partial [Acidimicrobiia bacterium]|nr:phage portal protein [Acidimicrobiia bacterium]
MDLAKLLPPVPGRAVVPHRNGNGIKSTTGVSFVGAPDWRRVIHLDGGSHPDAKRLTRAIALATSCYAYSAMTYRAQKIAEPPLMVVRDTDDGDAVFVEHELNELLDEPSLDYDMGVLLQLTEYYMLIGGQALWVKNDDLAGRMARLTPYCDTEFDSRGDEQRIYAKYEVSTKRGRVTYDPEDVVHFRDPNPSSWRKGLAKLDVALALLDLGHQVERTVRNFMMKAMFPGGIISPNADWEPEDDEWDQYVEAINAWHGGGADNSGEPLVLLGGTTFSRAAVPLKELLPGEILDRIEATVGSVMGPPPVVLGWKVGLENSPWSNMKEARQSTYEETLIPRMHFYEKALTKSMLTPEERKSGLRIAYDLSGVIALREDDERRAKVAASMRNEWTLDERRVYTGKEPIGGEEGAQIGSAAPPVVELSLPAQARWVRDVVPFDQQTEVASRLAKLGMKSVTSGPYRYMGTNGRFIRRQPRRGNVYRSSKGLVEWVMFDVGTKANERTWAVQVAKWLKQAE